MLPHGIDVLRKMDFFAVSLRKRAFLDAAPQVAMYVLPVSSSVFDPDSLLDTMSIDRILFII